MFEATWIESKNTVVLTYSWNIPKEYVERVESNFKESFDCKVISFMGTFFDFEMRGEQ